MKRLVLIHYGEIGLKRGNKAYFENRLIGNIKSLLYREFGFEHKISLSLGRILLILPEEYDESRYVKVLNYVFGVKNFKFVREGSLDLGKLADQIYFDLKELPELSKFDTFCVRVKRSQNLPFKSVEAERGLGAFLLGKGLNLKVRLDNPDLLISVEYFNEKAFYTFKKYSGPGGLPVGTSGRVVSLLSSGLDSPVASYRLMRRGANVIFLHFHSYPYSDMEEQEQVIAISEILNRYQLSSKLYLLPFGNLQKMILSNVDIPAKDRLLLFRRIMVKTAEIIAYNENAKAIVTGDNLGQVSSQTLDNIFAVSEVSNIPIFRPLISFDKEDIIAESELIGTYDISKLPCKDTCATFSPKSPELSGSIEKLQRYEEIIPLNDMIREMIEKAEIKKF